MMNYPQNIVEINGQTALIAFDAESGMLRGEFLGLTGGADFYASNIDGLIKEGDLSLSVYLAICSEKRIEPYKSV